MHLSIDFNWPDANHARVNLGTSSMEDANFDFRIGLVSKEHPDKVRWHVNDWVSGLDMDVTLTAVRTDRVVIEKRSKNSSEIDTRTKWDISEEWPAEAQGATMVNSGWTF